MIINDLDGCYIVFDTKNRNMELDTLSIWLSLHIESRTLCGCVDWNAVSLAMEANILRAYLHGIEMQQRLLLWCKMRYLYQKIVF